MIIGFLHMKRELKSACMELQKNSSMLSRLDTPERGDTFGLSTGKVALVMEKELDNWKESVQIKDFLEDMGMKIMEACDDDANLLWGSMFSGFSRGFNGTEIIDCRQLKKMLLSSLEAVEKVTASRVKDESFKDALSHVVGIMSESKQDIAGMLEEAAAAARSLKAKDELSRNAAVASIHLFFEGIAKGLYS